MKKAFCLLIVVAFLAVGCASNTMRGAGIGAGAGTIASVIAGKSGTTAALLIMGGALLGGAIGQAADQQAQALSNQPENRNKSIVVVEEEPIANTKCRKVTKRHWKNGHKFKETTEEVCTSTRQSDSYE